VPSKQKTLSSKSSNTTKERREGGKREVGGSLKRARKFATETIRPRITNEPSEQDVLAERTVLCGPLSPPLTVRNRKRRPEGSAFKWESESRSHHEIRSCQGAGQKQNQNQKDRRLCLHQVSLCLNWGVPGAGMPNEGQKCHRTRL
jgi:hypothetical protein